MNYGGVHTAGSMRYLVGLHLGLYAILIFLKA